MKNIKLLNYSDIDNMNISEVTVGRLEYNNPEEFIDHKMDYEKTPIMYGIELEINYLQGGNFRKRLAKYQEENNIDFFHCKTDSTLDEGIEIITHPFSKAWFTNNQNHFRNLLTIIYKSNGKIGRNTGLHIHISRQGIKNSTKAKLFHFINESENRSLISDIAGREQSSNYFNYYSGETLLSQEGLNRYEQNSGKYEAVNWQHNNSIEIRIFKATTKTNYLFARLQFIFLAIEFIKKTPVIECTARNFINYISKQTKYKDILEYIRDKELSY